MTEIKARITNGNYNGDEVWLIAKVDRLEANIRELFDAMTAGGGNRARTPENNERLVAAWAVLRETNAAAKEQV